MGEREGSRWKDGGEEMERGGREKGGERRRMQGRGGMDKSGQQQSWSRTFTQFKSHSDDWKWKRFDQRYEDSQCSALSTVPRRGLLEMCQWSGHECQTGFGLPSGESPLY